MRSMKILVLDNYDSFVYNLVHYLREMGHEPEVYRNDKITLEEVARFDKILLSPGPGLPSEAGIMLALIAMYAPTKSILGVCLGHQAIGEAFGATLENMTDVLHGIAAKTFVTKADERFFKDIPAELKTGRYHSWTVVPESMPETLEITAVDAEGRIMALSHKTYDVRGVQFHPESVLTEHGKQMLKNWLDE
jgi:anthranilate synthase component II